MLKRYSTNTPSSTEQKLRNARRNFATCAQQFNPITDHTSELAQQLPTQCVHHKKIIQMKEKIQQLQFEQKYLKEINDQILKNIEENAKVLKYKEDQEEFWKQKYLKLKMQNDEKAQKLAEASSSSALAQKSLNRNRSMTSRQMLKSVPIRSNYRTNPPKLTKEERQYVQHLQDSKRQRSCSLKMFESLVGRQKMYSAALPDGLIIHIIDDRPTFRSKPIQNLRD